MRGLHRSAKEARAFSRRTGSVFMQAIVGGGPARARVLEIAYADTILAAAYEAAAHEAAAPGRRHRRRGHQPLRGRRRDRAVRAAASRTRPARPAVRGDAVRARARGAHEPRLL